MTPCQKLLKQEGTARRIESMQQSSATPSLHLWFLGVAEDCCMLSILLAVPSCFNSFWHGVIPTSYFIFNDFYTCIYKGCGLQPQTVKQNFKDVTLELTRHIHPFLYRYRNTIQHILCLLHYPILFLCIITTLLCVGS